MPTALTQDLGEGIDPRAAEGAWTGWTTIRSAEKFFDLELEVGLLKEQAGKALRKRAEAWQPVAVAIAEWVATERASRDAAARLGEVRKAIEWLKKAGGELRNERLRPFSETSARVWEMLRQESNVELGPVTLTVTGNKMWCPCGKHWKTVKLTPSDPNYVRNLLGQLRRATCWDEEAK